MRIIFSDCNFQKDFLSKIPPPVTSRPAQTERPAIHPCFGMRAEQNCNCFVSKSR